ncbi:alpha/beta hydrolase fold [Amycolatopsis saalfeldensis]|uniref:Alpha/beta hydrolase fold n=1 Tax=Amycolatopsis saalfeldensis TaxID=394193 RepID=A0A1H8UWF9_9PSEU|nr:alpha/beta hydrolase fold [Amycolatopsis saalfeldensis]
MPGGDRRLSRRLDLAAGPGGVDPAWVAVGEQSAGGGLAAALVRRLHDESGRQPLAQRLFCPMLDDRTAARRDLDPFHGEDLARAYLAAARSWLRART